MNNYFKYLFFNYNCLRISELSLSPPWKRFIIEIGFEPVVQWLSYSPLDPRFANSNPVGVDEFFQGVKILNVSSFGREVKPWVPCRRFTERKRTSSKI